jgi:hypothetical protein
MAKNFLFALLFTALHLPLHPIMGFHGTLLVETPELKSDECTAPPPDSFRVTERSTNFISLAWEPTWQGATFQLSVSQKNAVGEWEPLLAPPIIQDTFYRVDNLESGKEYRFMLATRCSNGDPGTLQAYKDDGTLILELVLGGRIPINPQIVEDCQNIPLNYNWVGFRIDYQEGGTMVSNFFEYKKYAPVASAQGATWIMRGYYDNPPIYAAEPGQEKYPIHDVPKVPSIWPFKIIRKLVNSPLKEIAGFVTVSEKNFPPSVGLCVVQSIPWKPAYTFTPLVAESAMNPFDGENSNDRNSTNNTIDVKPIAQSPFTDNLNILFPSRSADTGPKVLRLISMNGQQVFKQRFEVSFDQASLPTSQLMPGVYVLVIESPYEVHTLQVIKASF